MSYLRSALTYGAALFLIALLVLFFGGLLLNGGAAPPGRGAGWGGGLPSAAPAQTGLLLAALCLGLGLGLACQVQASWGESAAALILCLSALHFSSPGGVEGLRQVLWQIDWLWREIPGPGPGWSTTLPVAFSHTWDLGRDRS